MTHTKWSRIIVQYLGFLANGLRSRYPKSFESMDQSWGWTVLVDPRPTILGLIGSSHLDVVSGPPVAETSHRHQWLHVI